MARATLSPTAGFCGFHNGSTTPSGQLSSLEQLPAVLPASSWPALPWEKRVTSGNRRIAMEMSVRGMTRGLKFKTRLRGNMAAWWFSGPSDAGIQFAPHVEVDRSICKTEEHLCGGWVCRHSDQKSDVPRPAFYFYRNLYTQNFHNAKVLIVMLFCMLMAWDKRLAWSELGKLEILAPTTHWVTASELPWTPTHIMWSFCAKIW